jgi:hypothetical protein
MDFSEKISEQMCINLINDLKSNELDIIIENYIKKYSNDKFEFLEINGVKVDTVSKNSRGNAILSLNEKHVNSIDSIIEKKALMNKLNPKNYNEAIEYLKDFSVENVVKQNLRFNSLAYLNELQIFLISKGKGKGKNDIDIPTYSLIDKGCGQSFENFSNTFLNAGFSNKINKFYLTGCFNTGSYTILNFLNGNKYQLILSKVPKELQDPNSKYSDHWTWTITRKFTAIKGKERLNTYRYLVINGELPHFPNEEGISLIPKDSKSLNGTFLKDGTFMQFYELDLGVELLTSDIKYKLQQVYPNIPLPIALFERREKYEKSHSENSVFFGLNYIPKLDERILNDNDKALIYSKLNVPIINCDYDIKYSIYLLNPYNKENNVKENEKRRRHDYSYIFSVNGQGQGFLPKSKFNEIRLASIKQYLSVVIDYSNIDTNELTDHIYTDKSGINEKSKLNEHVISVIEEDLKQNKFILDFEKKLYNDKLKPTDNSDLDSKLIENIANKMSRLLSINSKNLKKNNYITSLKSPLKNTEDKIVTIDVDNVDNIIIDDKIELPKEKKLLQTLDELIEELKTYTFDNPKLINIRRKLHINFISDYKIDIKDISLRYNDDFVIDLIKSSSDDENKYLLHFNIDKDNFYEIKPENIYKLTLKIPKYFENGGIKDLISIDFFIKIKKQNENIDKIDPNIFKGSAINEKIKCQFVTEENWNYDSYGYPYNEQLAAIPIHTTDETTLVINSDNIYFKNILSKSDNIEEKQNILKNAIISQYMAILFSSNIGSIQILNHRLFKNGENIDNIDINKNATENIDKIFVSSLYCTAFMLYDMYKDTYKEDIKEEVEI